MANSMPQGGAGLSLEHHRLDPQPWDLNFAEYVTFIQNMRRCWKARLLEFPQFPGLIGMSIGKNEAGVDKREETKGQEEVTRAAKDGRSRRPQGSRWLRKGSHFVCGSSCAVGCCSGNGV